MRSELTESLATPFLLEDELAILSGLAPHPDSAPLERPDLEANPYALPVLKNPQYLCPGETRPISRSVHLARLAAFYPPCRDCTHRQDAGNLPIEQSRQSAETATVTPTRSLFTPEGIRGTYLNELDRLSAGRYAAALAALLWDTSPLIARPATPTDAAHAQTSSPTVIVGHDERPHSIDLLTGIIQSLTRMSCHVINVGAVSLPCLWRTAELERTHAGIYVGAPGTQPSTIGLNFLWSGALPCTATFQLDKLDARLKQGTPRPLRRSADYRTLLPHADYEDTLTPWFHAFRPLKIVCAIVGRNQLALLQRLFANVACQVTFLSLPLRARDLHHLNDPDVRKLCQVVRDQQAHLGCLIDEDGQSILFCDEAGRSIPPAEIALLLALETLREHPGCTIALPHDLADQFGARITTQGGTIHPIPTDTLSDMSHGMRASEAHFGGSGTYRYWHRETISHGHFPQCDSLVTLATLLRTLSRSDTDFSQVLTLCRSGCA